MNLWGSVDKGTRSDGHCHDGHCDGHCHVIRAALEEVTVQGRRVMGVPVWALKGREGKDSKGSNNEAET